MITQSVGLITASPALFKNWKCPVKTKGKDILQSKISLTGPGFPFGEEGVAGEPRAPPPGYPGVGQMPRMPHGSMPGSGERWPQQHMVRPPHPGQVRPGKAEIAIC